MEGFKPLGDRIVVRPEMPEQQRDSGLFVVKEERPQRGEVLAVGSGGRDQNGVRHRPDVDVGDVVLFAQYGGTQLDLDDEKLLVLREGDILGVFTMLYAVDGLAADGAPL